MVIVWLSLVDSDVIVVLLILYGMMVVKVVKL